MISSILKSRLVEKIDSKLLLVLSFCIFSIIYFINFDKYNSFFSTDFVKFYKPNGILIIEKIINLEFSEINFFSLYLIPKLITGILLKLTPNESIFSTTSNFINIIALFLSFYFFLKSLFIKNNTITLIFLFVFFIYVANWEWCLWKLADIYFLFVFSLVFYFLANGLYHKNIISIFYGILFSIISLITKPQGVIILPFFIASLALILFYRENFFKKIIFSFLIYLLFFPLLIFFLIKFNIDNIAVKSFLTGKISWNIAYTYSQFVEQFNISKDNYSQIIYFYFLLSKKLIYQITFIRETYSFKHNVFLTTYVLLMYFFLIINFNYLVKKYNLFLKLTILIIFFATLLYCSLFTSSEPNRFQIFYLTPTYVLVSISIEKFIRDIRFYYKEVKSK
jgi:hypothetical protein